MPSAVRRVPRWVLAISLACALVLLVLVVLGLATRAWAGELAADERLLPGTVVAGVDVGEMTRAEAVSAVDEQVDAWLDGVVTVVDDEAEWSISPRDVGGAVEPEQAVADALGAGTSTGLVELARIRWLGEVSDVEVDASRVIDIDEVAAYVDGIAAEVDQPVSEATATWDDDAPAVVEDVTGRAVDRAEAQEMLAAALVGGEGRRDPLPEVELPPELELPVQEDAATVTTDDVEAVLPAVVEVIDQSLDRVVSLVDGDDSWELTPREVGAVPDFGAVLDAALDEPEELAEAFTDDPPVEVSTEEVAALVDGLAEEIDTSAVNAAVDYSTGWVELTGGRTGRTLDRDEAVAAIEGALRGEEDDVELPVGSVAPDRTRDDYRHVLLVRQNERRLYHYVDGDIVADWPVAVGTNDQPTPTGTFTIGAKRHMPSWHNPSPNGWGADMPDMVEPGRNNPLGVRALNWNRNGADTLIRFHGTADEGSIGRASSNGCVRMSNDHVIDLYDRVPSGATVVSIHA